MGFSPALRLVLLAVLCGCIRASKVVEPPTAPAPMHVQGVGTCEATPHARDACASMSPPPPSPRAPGPETVTPDAPVGEVDCPRSRSCRLEPPVGYWDWHGPAQGVRITEEEAARRKEEIASRPVPPCQCTCDPAFVAACAAQERERIERRREPPVP